MPGTSHEWGTSIEQDGWQNQYMYAAMGIDNEARNVP